MNNKSNMTYHSNSLQYTDGFTIIELMVAMAISLVVLLGLTIMFVNANANYRELANTTRQLDSGRYALQTLQADLRHAGFFGEFQPGGPANFLNPCNVTLADLTDAVRNQHLQGYTNAATYTFAGANINNLGCLNNRRPGTDALTVLRASSVIDGDTSDTSDLQANAFYLQSTHDQLVVNTGSNTGSFVLARTSPGTTPAPDPPAIRQVLVHTYYIRNCNICAGDNADAIPTLVRIELNAAGGNTVVPLAEGIEQLYLRYGVDTSPLNDPDFGNPNTYTTADLIADNQWQDIVAVEVNLLARNTEPSQGYTDTNTYTLGNNNIIITPSSDYPANERPFKRQVFSAVVRVENISQRRER